MLRLADLIRMSTLAVVVVGGCNSRSSDTEGASESTAQATLRLQGDRISADIQTYPQSGNGFNSTLTIKNLSATQVISNWEVDLNLGNATITGGPWMALVTSNGSTTTFRSVTDNATIYQNGTVTVTFNGAWASSTHVNPAVTAVRRDIGIAGTGGATARGGSSSSSPSGGALARGGAGGAGGTSNTGGSGGSIGGTTNRSSTSSGGVNSGGNIGNTATGGTSAANIALGKPATASSESLPGNPASFGNDSAQNTEWCASATQLPATWRVDLGGMYDLTGTSVTWTAALSGYGYIIQASPDNIAFSNVVDRQINQRSDQVQSDSFTFRARWVGISITRLPSSQSRACLRDFAAYGTAVSGTPGSGGSGNNASGGNTSIGGSASLGGTSSVNAGGVGGSALGGSSPAGGTSSTVGGTSGGSSSSISSTPITFSFQLPKGVDRSSIALSTTSGELWINDHAKVESLEGSGHFANVSAVANGRVTRLGYYAEVKDLWSDGNVTLANRALVHGDLYTRGTVDGQAGYEIFGKTVYNAAINPTHVVSWTVQFPDVAGEPTILQPSSGTAAPAPGPYAGFVVNRDAHLKLVAGTYYLNKLTVEAGGYLDIDNSAGAVIIYVRNDLTLRGTHSRAVDSGGLMIAYAGANTVPVETPYRGILVAPNAPVILATTQNPYAGSVYAKALTIHQYSSLQHEPWVHQTLCTNEDACSPLCPCSRMDSSPCQTAADCQSGLSCSSEGHCACVPQCANKQCGDDLSDGCGGQCPMVCKNGEIGCQRDSDCAEGSLCFVGKGYLKNFPPGTNICLPIVCSEADPRELNCGVGSADCGTCPVCKPECNGRECGPNGCGGTCGTLEANQVCLGGVKVDASDPAVDHSPGFPSAIRTNFWGPASEAGSIPGEFAITDRGGAGYTMPLQLPPGRHGLVPNLSLTYESTRGSGMVGVGWAIGGFSTIERCTRIPALNNDKADPITLTDKDLFCLDGVVLTAASDGSLKPHATHDTELEKFEVIRAIGNVYDGATYVGPSGFRVWTKDGHILTYGAVEEYNRQANHSTSTRYDAVVDNGKVHRAWHLSQIEDHAGNFVSFAYERTIDDQGTVSEIVPTTVAYGQKQDPENPASNPYIRPTAAVTFTYVDNPAPMHHFVAGYPAYQTKLLSRIDTYALSEVGSPYMGVATYKLEYSNEPPGARLGSVTQCSRGISGGVERERCLPSTRFSYTESEWQTVGPVKQDDPEGFTDWPKWFSADVNGDGSKAAIRQFFGPGDSDDEVVGVTYILRWNRSSGKLEVSQAQTNDFFGYYYVALDVNQDGRDDLVNINENKLFRNMSNGGFFKFDKKSFFNPGEFQSGWSLGQLSNLNPIITDYDGNGLSDLVIDSFACFLCEKPPSGTPALTLKRQVLGGFAEQETIGVGSGFSTVTNMIADLDGDRDQDIFAITKDGYKVIPLPESKTLPMYSQVRPTWRLDANGDGLVDFIQALPRVIPPASEDKFVLLLNTGNGFTARPFTAPRLGWDIQEVHNESSANSFVADFDYDGRDDVVIHEMRNPAKPGSAVLRGMPDGTMKWEPLPAASLYSNLPEAIAGTSTDLNGDGLLDVIYLDKSGYSARMTWQRPGLLKQVTNGLGARVSIEYSTKVNWPGVDGSQQLMPTYTPGALPVTANSKSLRQVTPLVSSYSFSQVDYETGGMRQPGSTYALRYFDAREGLGGRGWYGFAEKWIAEIDPDGRYISETRTHFHNDDFWRAGLVEQTVTNSGVISGGLNSASTKMTVTENTWQKLTSAISGRPYPWLSTQTTFEWEGGEIQRTIREWTPDSYGNVAMDTKRILVDGTEATSSRIETQYHVDSSRWLVSLPELVTTTDIHGDTAFRQVRYEYTDDGLLSKTIREPGRADLRLTQEYVRDPISRNVERTITSDSGGATRIERILYDQKDLFPVAHINAADELTEVQHDPRTGQLLTVQDPNGVVTRWGYDPFGRIELVESPNQELRRSYIPIQQTEITPAKGAIWVAGAIEETLNPGGTTITRHDAYGRVSRTLRSGLKAKIVSQEFERDWAGHVIAESLPHQVGSKSQGVLSYKRDVLGRVTSMTAPDGKVTQYGYFNRGNYGNSDPFDGDIVYATATLAPNGLISYALADERAVPKWVIEYDASVGTTPMMALVAGIASASRYDVGAFGIPHSMMDADLETTTFVHDGLGRRTGIESDSTGSTTTQYNAFGEVTDETDANGEKLCYSYDIAGRITAVRRSPDGVICDESVELIRSWQYGTELGEIGKVVSTYRQSRKGTTTGTMDFYRYEAPIPGLSYAGRLKSVERSVPGLADTLTTGYDYDGPYLKTVHYPSAAGNPFAVQYDRDSVGNVISLVDASSGQLGTEHWKLLSDDEGQRIGSEALAGGSLVTNFGYMSLTSGCGLSDTCVPGTLREIRTSPASNPSISLQHFTYRYDISNNIKRIDTYEAGQSVASVEMLNDIYGRLHFEDEDSQNNQRRTTFNYSAGGDIESVTTVGVGGHGSTDTYSYMPSRPRLVQAMITGRYGYDQKGRQILRTGSTIPGGSQTVDYNELDLPEKITVGSNQTHRFEYDAGGARSVTRFPDVTTVYAGDHYRCTGTTPASGNTITCDEHHYRVFLEGRLIAEVTKDSLGATVKQRYVQSDHVGSPTLITDETGQVIEKRNFVGFGDGRASFSDAELTAGYTGHDHDSALGLVNMRGRMYDPQLRRFLTPDPFVTEPLNPRGLNRFAYVQNSPHNFVDPSGFDGEPNRDGYSYTEPNMTGVTQNNGDYRFGDANITVYASSNQTPIPMSYSRGYPDSYGGMQSRSRELVSSGGGAYFSQGPDPASMMSGTPQSSGTTTPATGPSSESGSVGPRSGSGSGGTGASANGAGGSPQSQESVQNSRGQQLPFVPGMTEGELSAYFLILKLVAPALTIAAVINKGPNLSVPLNPTQTPVFRGGSSMVVRPGEVKTSAAGLVVPNRGLSLSTNAESIAQRFGSANQIKSIPEGLQIVQRGSNMEHYEVVPTEPMTLQQYQNLLNQIKFH